MSPVLVTRPPFDSFSENPSRGGGVSEKSTRTLSCLLKTEAVSARSTSAFLADATIWEPGASSVTGCDLELELAKSGSGADTAFTEGALFYVTDRNKLCGETCQEAELWRLFEAERHPANSEAGGQEIQRDGDGDQDPQEEGEGPGGGGTTRGTVVRRRTSTNLITSCSGGM